MTLLSSFRYAIQLTTPFANNANMRLQKRENVRRLAKRRMVPTKEILLLDAKIHQPPNLTLDTNSHIKKTFVASVKLMDMI